VCVCMCVRVRACVCVAYISTYRRTDGCFCPRVCVRFKCTCLTVIYGMVVVVVVNNDDAVVVIYIVSVFLYLFSLAAFVTTGTCDRGVTL